RRESAARGRMSRSAPGGPPGARAASGIPPLPLDRSYRAVADLFPSAALARAQDRVTHLGRPIAILEVRAIRPYVSAGGDRLQKVVDLVHERVLPADDVAVRPPPLPEGVRGLGH